MKSRNWTLEIEHHHHDEGFGTIKFNGRPDLMFEFDFDINTRSHDGNGRFDDIDVKVRSFEFDDERNHNVQINQRNINLLCSLIEEIINDDVTAFGFDFDDHDELKFDEEPTIWSTIYSGHPSRVRDL
jgi:hypothetical protein